MPILNNIIIAPVDFKRDVAIVLGSSSGDEGTLCKHPSINIWAKYKPVRHWSVGPISLSQRKAVNYGFDLSSVEAWDLADVMSYAQTYNNGWPYNKPRGKAGTQDNPTPLPEYYRILDFDGGDGVHGYNHGAVAPYELEEPTHLSVRENKIVGIFEDPAAEIKISDFDEGVFDVGDISTDVYVYLLVRVVGTNVITPYTPVGGVLPISDISSEQGHIARFSIPFTWQGLPLSKTFELVGAASSWNSEDGEPTDEYPWIFLPGTRRMITINDQNYTLDLEYKNQDRANDFLASVNAGLDVLSLTIDVREINKNLGDVAESVLFHLEVEYYDGTYYNPIHSEDINGYDLDQGDEQDNYLHIQRTINISDASHDLSRIYVRLWYQFVSADEPLYLYYRYFVFLDNAGYSFSYTPDATHSHVPRVSIYDILNYSNNQQV